MDNHEKTCKRSCLQMQLEQLSCKVKQIEVKAEFTKLWGVLILVCSPVGVSMWRAVTWGENRTDFTLFMACCTCSAWKSFSGFGWPPKIWGKGGMNYWSNQWTKLGCWWQTMRIYRGTFTYMLIKIQDMRMWGMRELGCFPKLSNQDSQCQCEQFKHQTQS